MHLAQIFYFFSCYKRCITPRHESMLGFRVVYGPEPETSSSRTLPFFWNRNGLESIFHLPEQEFLYLRLILFMKGFLPLIAQFSSNLFAACAIPKCRK